MFNKGRELYNDLIRLINEWMPENFPSEGEYKKELWGYLKDLQDDGITIIKDCKIDRENGANRVDVAINEVGIKLKKDLKTGPATDRFIRQIKKMLKEFDFLILVLVGKYKERFVYDLKNEVIGFIKKGKFMGSGKEIKIIEIGDFKDEGRFRKI